MSGYAIGIFHDWSHRVHSIDAACCDRHMSHVAWSVCVGHMDVLCKKLATYGTDSRLLLTANFKAT